MRLAPVNASAKRRLGTHAFGAFVFGAALVLGAALASLWATGTGAPVRFAVIGDYGRPTDGAMDVAELVKGWEPDLVITLGDNNYECGEAATIARNIGRHYCDFIHNPGAPDGQRCAGSAAADGENRFFPALGNHDWGQGCPGSPGTACQNRSADPYLAYFDLPGNERYYEFTKGPVHFFALDSDCNERDGNTADSKQAAWLEARLKASRARYKLVYFHHPPYTSDERGPRAEMRWPFKEWGATAVLAGHSHHYERINAGGLTYFVNGLGGAETGERPHEFSENGGRYGADHGAMLVTADDARITFEFVTRAGKKIDGCSIPAAPQPSVCEAH